jgi:hypothetical protein
MNLASVVGVFGSSFSALRGAWHLAASLQRNHPQAFLKAGQLFMDEFKKYAEDLAGPFA